MELDGPDVVEVTLEAEEAPARGEGPDLDEIVVATGGEEGLRGMEGDAADGAFVLLEAVDERAHAVVPELDHPGVQRGQDPRSAPGRGTSGGGEDRTGGRGTGRGRGGNEKRGGGGGGGKRGVGRVVIDASTKMEAVGIQSMGENGVDGSGKGGNGVGVSRHRLGRACGVNGGDGTERWALTMILSVHKL